MDHNPAQEINPHIPAAARWIGATPLVVFLAVYLLTSLILRDFYAMPITVAFLVSSVYAVAITRGLSTEKRVLRFSRGVADYNLLMMIWIFVLAGAFSEAAKSIGAIDATVHLILRLLPAGLLLPGLFLASCVISLSIGTSVGTVVALVPIALGLSEPLGLPVEYIAAVVTGGAFFGDNLSFISDTTIAATRTQGCSMRDKFRINLRIVLPAAIATFVIYAFQGAHLTETLLSTNPRTPYLALPYLVVLI
ncbi:MAG: Na+/H+ antiporter NhaC family protein, partial [Tannerella sp.]